MKHNSVLLSGWLLCSLVGFAVNSYAAPVTPNLYEMQGRGVQVTYSSSSLTGEPQLTYTTGTQSTTYSGTELLEERTTLGLLVTVTTAFRPDVDFTTFSVMIPDINLQATPVNFSTVAFITTHSTPFISPSNLEGPVQTYKTLRLRGKASLVNFLSNNTGISGTVSLNTCIGTPPPAGCVYPFTDAPIEILDTGNNVIAKATTNVDGMFKVDVTPGAYVVHVVTNGIFPSCPDAKADVPKSGYAVVDVSCMAIR